MKQEEDVTLTGGITSSTNGVKSSFTPRMEILEMMRSSRNTLTCVEINQ